MTLPELFCPRHRARHSPLSGQRPARGSRAAALPASAELHPPRPGLPPPPARHTRCSLIRQSQRRRPGMLKEPLPGRTQQRGLVIGSPFWGVYDVADVAFELRRGHVI